MCGILGAFGPSAKNLFQKAKPALDLIKHRGPDAEGLYLDPQGRFFLGHRRLSILDLSTQSNQPMFAGKDALVYNGEIYNHQSLRSSSLKYGTSSDTESLLKASDLKNFLQSSIGMFAGAHWKDSESKLTLFSDSLGIKPLFYTILTDSTYIFSSEERPVLYLSQQSIQINLDSIKCFLSFENFPDHFSAFSSIKRLKRGTLLHLSQTSDGKVKVESDFFEYQSIGSKQSITHFDQAVKIASENFSESVSRHLLSDASVAVYLSGGIDSSLVATLAAENYKEKMTGYTGYFEESSFFDERPLSRAVAKKAGINLEEVKISSQDFINNFDDLITSLAQPRMSFGSFS